LIIDDDGLGYVEDGRRTRTRGTEASRRTAMLQQPHAVRNGEIRTSNAIQQISSMFTSSVFKRPGSDRAKSLALATDSIVDGVIAEFAPDENDREERRQRAAGW
jgi:DNA polymerase alpha subunit A